MSQLPPAAPLMPPTDEEMAAAQSRLAVAIDRLHVTEAEAKRVLGIRQDARAEYKNAGDSWREMRRQLGIVEQFSLDLTLALDDDNDPDAAADE